MERLVRNRGSLLETRWLRHAFAAGAFALVASCSGDSPTQPGGLGPVAQGPGSPDFLLTSEGGQCMFEDYADFASTGGTPTCTTNDIRIARTEVTSVDGEDFNPTTDQLLCAPLQEVELGITLFLEETAASDREDVGIWIAEDGGNAKTGQCRHYVIDANILDPTVFNPDGDECAGVSSQEEAVVDLGILTVQCPESGSSISIGSCIAWQIPGANEVCPSGEDDGTEEGFRDPTVPGSPAKCTCEPFNIPIILVGKVIIEKQTVNNVAGSFEFSQNIDASGNFSLSDDGTKEFTNLLPGTFTVTELAAAGTELISIVCTDPTSNSSGVVATGVATINVASGETVRCVYTNEADAVTVTKDADPSFTRTYEWNVEKTLTGDAVITLDPGQVFSQEYNVEVTNTGSTDSDFGVSGTITIHNPTSHTVTISSVTDAIAGVGSDADVVCPGVFPQDLASGADLVCTYSDDLPDGATRLNTASVTLASIATAFTGTASVNFAGQSPDTEVDECVDAKDEGDLGNTDPLGTVCVGDAPETFTYSWPVPTGAAQCGTFTYNNTATITTNDTQTTDTDDASLQVTIECPVGCTLTQGYWKTHNDLFRAGQPGGPASDPDWSSVGGPGATFFLSGQTWFEVFWTAPKGNVYYNLAHQYMAAVLNLTGATPSADVQLAIDQATALFNTYTPAEILLLKGKNGNEVRAEFIRLAGILGAFNEGLLGVEHCTEDGTSA
jgi:hypothetical protein